MRNRWLDTIVDWEWLIWRDTGSRAGLTRRSRCEGKVWRCTHPYHTQTDWEAEKKTLWKHRTEQPVKTKVIPKKVQLKIIPVLHSPKNKKSEGIWWTITTKENSRVRYNSRWQYYRTRKSNLGDNSTTYICFHKQITLASLGICFNLDCSHCIELINRSYFLLCQQLR